jgi:peptidoglycan/LPS O-acetylase OafA/YrhL
MRYVPALDGVRALAVLAVVCLHAGFPWASWGFLGVDVFFVLSGFLITALLLAEHAETGTISLANFYRRRALRLFPSLIAVLVVVGLWSATLAPDDLAAQSRVGILATVFYVANWVDALTDLKLGQFQHTWSLAIEEQFYLLWPVLLAALLRRRWSWQGLALLTGGLALTSAVWKALVWNMTLSPARVYGGFDTRADALLMGCLLAILLANLPILRSRRVGYLILPIVLVFLLIAGIQSAGGEPVAWRSSWWWNRGGFTLAAFIAALLVLLAATDSVSFLTRLLSVPPLVRLGRVSYSVYLWHYVIFKAISHSGVALTDFEKLNWIGVSVAAATLSWVAIEQPALRHKYRRADGSRPAPDREASAIPAQ